MPALLEMRIRTADIDPLEQLVTLEVRVEHFEDGRSLATEQDTVKIRRYAKNELIMMLEQTGFRDIDVRGAYNDAPATPDDNVLVFIARK